MDEEFLNLVKTYDLADKGPHLWISECGENFCRFGKVNCPILTLTNNRKDLVYIQVHPLQAWFCAYARGHVAHASL